MRNDAFPSGEVRLAGLVEVVETEPGDWAARRRSRPGAGTKFRSA